MKNCKLCGKPFEPPYPCTKYCCNECREKATKQNKKIYYDRIGRFKRYYKPVSPKKCKICGCDLPHNRQVYCLDCLLKGWLYAPKGKEHDHYNGMLHCRGYDKEMILYECEERGLINGTGKKL